MKTRYATAAEFLHDFALLVASKQVGAPPLIHRPSLPLERKVLKPGALRHTPPRPLKVKP